MQDEDEARTAVIYKRAMDELVFFDQCIFFVNCKLYPAFLKEKEKNRNKKYSPI